jgi:hypothetical protein
MLGSDAVTLLCLQGSEAATWSQVLPSRRALQGGRMELRGHHQGKFSLNFCASFCRIVDP